MCVYISLSFSHSLTQTQVRVVGLLAGMPANLGGVEVRHQTLNPQLSTRSHRHKTKIPAPSPQTPNPKP